MATTHKKLDDNSQKRESLAGDNDCIHSFVLENYCHVHQNKHRHLKFLFCGECLRAINSCKKGLSKGKHSWSNNNRGYIEVSPRVFTAVRCLPVRRELSQLCVGPRRIRDTTGQPWPRNFWDFFSGSSHLLSLPFFLLPINIILVVT